MCSPVSGFFGNYRQSTMKSHEADLFIWLLHPSLSHCNPWMFMDVPYATANWQKNPQQSVPQIRPRQTYLDCDFLQNYLRWTTPESDWLDEAFVSGSPVATDRCTESYQHLPGVYKVFGWHVSASLADVSPHLSGLTWQVHRIRSMLCRREDWRKTRRI